MAETLRHYYLNTKTMIFSIIAAMAENRVIGLNNKMPWDLPTDRRRFHRITRGHPVILEGIPSKALAGRCP